MMELFHDDERYTEVAEKMDREFQAAIEPLVNQFVGMGFSAREIGIVLHSVAACLIAEKVLEKSWKNSV